MITCITQDREGYIWIGTEYGLNKYDGYRFTNYLHDEGNNLSINSNNITSLFVDDDGNLWVGTGIGLAYYDDANNHFERVVIPGVATPRINDIIKEDDQHLLIGTSGYGLFRLTVKTRKVTQVHGYAQGDEDYFNHIFIDNQGNFWKGGAQTVVSIRTKDGKVRNLDSPYGNVTAFANFHGGVLIVCQRGLLFSRDGQIVPDFIDTTMLGNETTQFRSAISDEKGNLFIGTLGKGLCWIPQASKRIQFYEHASSSFDLKTANIWALFEDNQDNLWVGCLKRGLLLLPQREPQFNSWSLSSQNVSVGGSVTSFCMGDNGITWCAVQNNGIYGFDANGKMVAHPSSPPKTYSIYRDSQGSYWVGTGDGLFSYNPLTGEYVREVSLCCDYVNTMTDDGNGHLFISTFSQGFCSYDIKTKAVRQFSMRDDGKVKGRLHNNWIMTMMMDSQGKLWIGTSSNLCCYDPVRDNFKPYGWEVLMEGKTVTSFHETYDHHMIIGTDMGLYLYDAKKGDVEPYERGKELSQKVICGIIQDKYGDIWCSTSMGIWQYQRDQERWITYVNGNGLLTREYVRGLAMQNAKGDIFFGISDGITSFHPSTLREHRPMQSKVHLTSLLIGGNPVNCQTLSNGEPVMEETLAVSDHFSLSYIDNTFAMEFSLYNYASTENVVFEYRMNGTEEWSETTAGNNVISFNHIQPGTYTLEVRAYDNGAYTDVQTYYIEVRAPWYRTSWAYLIYIIGILAFLGLIGYNWHRNVIRRMDEEKMKFLINATHDIRSPLTLIMNPLHKLLRQDLNSDVKTELKTIAHNVQRVQNLVNQILDIRKIDKQQMKLHCQETDIVQYVGKILKAYEYTAKERNIDFRYSPAVQKLMVWFDHSALDKIVDNLLSNAFKFTYDNGAIEVRVSEGPNHTAELQVIDNGMGIKGETSRLFDRFYQGSTSHSLHIEGTGIGLNLCKMMVEMHHGTIEAANREDVQGSIFTVRLPLGNGHLSSSELSVQEDTKKIQKPKSQYLSKVLVVDDDVEIGDYIGRELGQYYKIVAVTNARKALQMLLKAEPEKQFDLVVSDVMMPEMDGFSFLRMIKTNMFISHIPVVMLTSKSDVANRLKGLEKGADAFLAKPFDMDELHVTISNLISKNLRLKAKYTGKQQQKDKVVKKELKSNDDDYMERVMKVVNEHLSDSDFSVEMLAKELSISRAQLHRKMKEMTGIPISEFIRNIRLEQAARLLKEQKVNVSQVAYNVGFDNLAYFSTIFRKQFGVSPTEYVEQIAENS